MSWIRVAIIVGLQIVALIGVWLITWAYTQWPTYKLESMSLSEIAKNLNTPLIGLPIVLGVVGFLMAVGAAVSITVYLFRSDG